jgi:transcriptional regulator with XRE-family HTH domain
MRRSLLAGPTLAPTAKPGLGRDQGRLGPNGHARAARPHGPHGVSKPVYRRVSPVCDGRGSMDRHRRTRFEVDGSVEASSLAGSLGRDLRTTARRRRLTQVELGRRVGLSGPRIGEIQRGQGASASLETWVKLGKAVGRPLAVSFSRDIEAPEARDAGHLAAQELVFGLARRHGRRADFELPTRPSDAARSIDVALRDDAARALIVVEIWNRLDDLGGAARASSRKVVEAEGPAMIAARIGPAYRVALCWLSSIPPRTAGSWLDIQRSSRPDSQARRSAGLGA